MEGRPASHRRFSTLSLSLFLHPIVDLATLFKFTCSWAISVGWGLDSFNRGRSTAQAYPILPRTSEPIIVFSKSLGRCRESLLAMAAIVLAEEIREFKCEVGDRSLSNETPRTSILSVGATRQEPTLMGRSLEGDHSTCVLASFKAR